MSVRPTTRVVTRLLFVVALALTVLAPASAAFASAARDDYPPSSTPTTDPCSRSSNRPAVCGTAATRASSTSEQATLPFTGGDVALLTVLGLCVTGGGVLLVWLGRRSRSSAA